jgi:hypothetical protein
MKSNGQGFNQKWQVYKQNTLAILILSASSSSLPLQA